MRIFIFMIWCLLGFCLFLSGCSASIRAADLEAAFNLRAIGEPPPMVQEVHIDKDRLEPK